MATEREIAKSFSRLHLHPVESATWDGDLDRFSRAVAEWGLPPSMSVLGHIFAYQVDTSKVMSYFQALVDAHKNDCFGPQPLTDLVIRLHESNSIGNRKIFTRNLVSIVSLLMEQVPGALTPELQALATHLGIVNEAPALLYAIGLKPGYLEPSPAVMFSLADACSLNAFGWIKPYADWSDQQQAQFSELFMAQSVRRRPSNSKQTEVLMHIWKAGLPEGFNLREKDVSSKESVRTVVLACRIRVAPTLLHKASPAFRIEMAKAGLATTAEAQVKGSTLDNLFSTDLGL